MGSPMLHGCDLRTVQQEHPECFALMLNADIIAVNQDKAALPAKLVYQHPPFPHATTGAIKEQVFARPLSGGRTAVVMLNRGQAAVQMSVTWQQLGFQGSNSTSPYAVHDVIAQKPVAGTVVGKYAAVVQSHDVSFIILTPAPLQQQEVLSFNFQR
jgi:alpha-galactosidase